MGKLIQTKEEDKQQIMLNTPPIRVQAGFKNPKREDEGCTQE